MGTDQFLNPDLILGLFFSAMRRIIIPPYFFLRKITSWTKRSKEISCRAIAGI